jgi:outer membrane protein assembly factor BamB
MAMMPRVRRKDAAMKTSAWMVMALLVAARAADQPQWGAPLSRNLVSAETNLPDRVDPTNGVGVKWVADLGNQCFATPIIAGGRVYIGANNAAPRDPAIVGDRGVLMCFDEQTGAFRWQLACPKLTNSVYWDWTACGLCSPATVADGRVIIVSNRGELWNLDPAGPAGGALSVRESDARWRFDYIKQCGVRQHDSAHGSPLVVGNVLYVNTSNGVDDTHKGIAAPDAPSLIGLDLATGRLAARDGERIGPDIFHSTWSSPACGEVNGRPLIFFCGGNGVIYAFEALAAAGPEVATLKKVWWCDFDPATPKQDIHSYLRNRKESPSNIYGMPVFHDGRLYVAGGGDMWWGKREAWLKCFDVTGTGDVTKTATRWSYPLERHTCATPAISDGLVYITDIGHFVHCVDAATGQLVWKHDTEAEVWASPLVADGKVYIGTRKGELLIFAAGREKQLLCSAKLEGAINGTPTAANGTLFIATMKRLYAFAKPAAK